jgi:hypothetical protein
MVTSKDYTTKFKNYGEITVPKGTKVTHWTANGYDENYHFVEDLSWVKKYDDGSLQYGLLHDLTYYGLNVPKEFICK